MLQQIRREVYSLLLDLRSLDRVIKGEPFVRAFQSANQTEQECFEIMISACCSEDKSHRDIAMSLMRKEIRRLNNANWNIRDLRDHAEQLGIPGWSRLDKESLLSAIEASNGRTNQSSSNTNQNDTSRSGVETVNDCVQEGTDRGSDRSAT